jgi:hypothetical protein
MTRALEARLIRLERQRHQPRSVRAITNTQLLRVIGISAAAFERMAADLDNGADRPPTWCNQIERIAWTHLRTCWR